jgi:hypothetical protein
MSTIRTWLSEDADADSWFDVQASTVYSEAKVDAGVPASLEHGVYVGSESSTFAVGPSAIC